MAGRKLSPSAGSPAVFRLTDHLRRLRQSAHLFLMDMPYSLDELVEATKQTVRVNQVESCYIRPIAYLGYGEMGLNPLPSKVRVSIAIWPWGTYLGEEGLTHGVRAKTSSWVRIGTNMIPTGTKACGVYINSSLAKVEAVKAGYDEAILLNEHGYITDGSGENVFIVRDGALATPPIQAGCLDGITRRCVITMARDLGYEVVEENLVRTDLYNADECFFTGTAAEITPIREVDDRTVGEGHRGPVTQELQGAFFAATKGETDAYASWPTSVSD